MLLVHYEHHKTASLFRSSHAIYIRPGAKEIHLKPNEVSNQLRTRTLSLRGFSQAGMMLEADLTTGNKLEKALARMFQDSAVSYIHIHDAKPGCYGALAERTITS